MIRQAVCYLLAGAEEPSAWQRHSLATAFLASRIANALPHCNAELAITGALLHDVGRQISCGLFHGLYGYFLLKGHRLFSQCARFCITHWLKGRTEKEILQEGDLPAGCIKRLLGLEDFVNLGVEDLVVNVADSVARRDVVVSIHARYEDAARRYGASPWLDGNKQRTLRFKAQLDRLAGRDIYTLFPPFGTHITLDMAFKKLGL